jgi:hypothetical protein
MTRKAGAQEALIAAFRHGLGLAGLAVIRGSSGIRVAAVGADGVSALAAGESGEVRFWCRHAADAQRIVATAKSKMPPGADQVLITAAARIPASLYSDAEITAEAVAAIGRVEQELESLRVAGALKSGTRSYRDYRQDAAARGEKIVPYAIWFSKYKGNLVRQLAAALRYF